MTGRGRALLASLLAVTVGGLAYLFGVGSVQGQRAEARVLEAAVFSTTPPAPLGLVSVPSVALTLLLLGAIAWWVHGVLRAFALLCAAALAIAASQLLKDSVLDRPDLFELGAVNTFPSGHMTVFTVVVAGLLWAMPQGSRLALGIMSVFLLGAVSWQLLHFGWHRPSDVVGAQALGVAAFALLAAIGPRRSKRSAVTYAVTGSSLFVRLTLLGLTFTAFALLAGSALLVWFASSVDSDQLMLNAGKIGMLGVSALTARVLLRIAP